MQLRTMLSMFAVVGVLAPSAAQAEVSLVRGQFTDRVERSMPVGDSTALANARAALYWVEVRNTGPATQVTLVWRADGREVQRQTLDVGTAARWRTWGRRPVYGAHRLQVEVLDAEGHSLRTDDLTVRP